MNEIDILINNLENHLNYNSSRISEWIILKASYQNLYRDIQLGVLSMEQEIIHRTKLLKSILGFKKSLSQEDYSTEITSLMLNKWKERYRIANRVIHEIEKLIVKNEINLNASENLDKIEGISRKYSITEREDFQITITNDKGQLVFHRTKPFKEIAVHRDVITGENIFRLTDGFQHGVIAWIDRPRDLSINYRENEGIFRRVNEYVIIVELHNEIKYGS